MNIRLSLLAGAAVIGIAAISAPQQASASVCYTTSTDDTDCGIIITLNSNGTATVTSTGQGPYDGVEDTLVGVINNSGGTVGSIHLSSSETIFGFDGDGIDTFGAPGNGSDSTGYGGPISYFTNIVGNTGDVNFLGGLASGASTYFSLEESLSEADFTQPVTSSPAPEPASLALLGGGLAALGALRRRRKTA